MSWRVRGQGPQHRPDDVSRIPPQRKGIEQIAKTVTDSGNLIPTTNPNLWYSLNLARRVREYRNTLLANTVTQITFDNTCCGLEILNDSPSTGVAMGVSFGPDSPVVPSDTTVMQASAEVKPGEGRFFDVKVDQITIKTGSVAANVRVTVLLP